jgi:hypothetical protein
MLRSVGLMLPVGLLRRAQVRVTVPFQFGVVTNSYPPAAAGESPPRGRRR